MKKFLSLSLKGIALSVMFLVSQSVFAQQILTVEEVVEYTSSCCGCSDVLTAHLSNGETLRIYKDGRGYLPGKHRGNWVHIDFITLKKGDMVLKTTSGEAYTKVVKRLMGSYTIKKVSLQKIKTLEIVSLLESVYTQQSWLNSRKITKNAQKSALETTQVANVFFTNGKTVTIPINGDPIWLDAEAGMKVNHYRIIDNDVYELTTE